jgi:hypothetical protein
MNIFKKEIQDADFKKYKGKYFGESWYSHIVESDNTGYYLDSSGFKKILFIFKTSFLSKLLRFKVYANARIPKHGHFYIFFFVSYKSVMIDFFVKGI